MNAGKYMSEFNRGEKIRDSEDGMVVEILQKYDNQNIKFKVIENGHDDLPNGKIAYIHSCDNYNTWDIAEEHSKNISPESIKELEKSIQKEKTNLNEFVENTRKNISDMEKSLENLKKTANKIPTIVIGEMYSYDNSEDKKIVGVCTQFDSSDNSYRFDYITVEQDELMWEWVYVNQFGTLVTNFKHLNSPDQKKIAAGFYAFFTGDVPGV